ncbi:unnamed protein product [Gadus morhua 'NCC']
MLGTTTPTTTSLCFKQEPRWVTWPGHASGHASLETCVCDELDRGGLRPGFLPEQALVCGGDWGFPAGGREGLARSIVSRVAFSGFFWAVAGVLLKVETENRASPTAILFAFT